MMNYPERDLNPPDNGDDDERGCEIEVPQVVDMLDRVLELICRTRGHGLSPKEATAITGTGVKYQYWKP